MPQERLVSGIQPTGRMHLGNYMGAIQNWIKLQQDYDAYFMIADYHALTTIYENPGQLQADKAELLLDLLGAGVDPNSSCLFFQSDVPEHTELHLILSMITPLPWLTRVPTYKGKIEEIKDKDLNTYGFLGYPVLQAADIMLYKGSVVPVGKDQLPHLELAREITRRFNHIVSSIFPEPEAKLTESPVLAGTDGRKMSKSYNNTLPLSDTEEQTQKKIMKMVTDPNRVKRTDPGNPDICSVFMMHQATKSDADVTAIRSGCQEGTLGCVDCKRDCAVTVNSFLQDYRARRADYAKTPEAVTEIIHEGGKRARKVAIETISEVKEAIGL